ncbi:MAG TPA: phage tail sheath subtilisin-like domain-containing protein [Thermoanaerobaculia bacterium]
MPTYDTPGVYIEEQTGPGVIAGVGTSTAAFIGPARRGPLREPRRISSWDEFLEHYAVTTTPDGLDPYIVSPRRFYMAHAVRGFYLNGGRHAYIVRVGTGNATVWNLRDQAPTPAVAFRVRAKQEGKAGDQIKLEVKPFSATGATGVEAAAGDDPVASVSPDGLKVKVADPKKFRVGDVVAKQGAAGSRAEIKAIDSTTKELTLGSAIATLVGGGVDKLQIADLVPGQKTVRLKSTTGISPGSVVKLKGDNATPPPAGAIDEDVVIESVDAANFVRFAAAPTKSFTIGTLKLVSQDFTLEVTPPVGAVEKFEGLSLDPRHPKYVRSAVNSSLVEILPPTTSPATTGIPALLATVEVLAIPPGSEGKDDDPTALTPTDFENGLAALENVDEVNLVCIPDAVAFNSDVVAESIHDAMVGHCEKLKERFAILDAPRGLEPSPTGVEAYRQKVDSARGFGALYYPWLVARDPFSKKVPPDTMLIPPSGHLAGVYARTDQERGVHKAPANTDVRGVLGLERKLTDAQQGPLNLKGINVLRIFQGSSTVVVWGARTIVAPTVTDWVYVNVRRLLLYIEESVEEGIRFAVFEPNNLALWQKLKRTIGEFLTRVWRDGALFGEKAEQAFYVRIDEALNPPSVRALGRLYIEIAVAPVRPAEFIIVRIGLWDGGAEVTES